MATYRKSTTPAQRAARKWQQEVDDLNRQLAMYSGILAQGRQLSDYDAMRQRATQRRLNTLMANNPFEAV